MLAEFLDKSFGQAPARFHLRVYDVRIFDREPDHYPVPVIAGLADLAIRAFRRRPSI